MTLISPVSTWQRVGRRFVDTFGELQSPSIAVMPCPVVIMAARGPDSSNKWYGLPV
jgi:hypothetical protein